MMMLLLQSIRRFRHPGAEALREALVVWALVMLALFVRLLLAPHPGFDFDLTTNMGWGRSAVELGLARSYIEQVGGNMLPNYAPLTLMFFAAMGWIQQLFFGGFDGDPFSYHLLIKLPSILFEVCTVLYAYTFLRRWQGWKAAAIAGLVYALHPAVLHNGAVWGQTDSIFTFFLLVATGFCATKKPFVAGIFLGLALMSKMQAVALVPLFLVIGMRTHWQMLLRGALGSFAAIVPILTPFALGDTLDTVLSVYTGAVGYYSVVASAAYNFWWSLYGDEAGLLSDTEVLLGIAPYRDIGILLFVCSIVFAVWALWKYLRSEEQPTNFPLPIFVLGAFISHAFFLWNTQMHERYLFPFVAFGLPMLLSTGRLRTIYVWISALFYANLLGWLPFSSLDRLLYTAFPMLDVLIASMQVTAFFFFAHALLLMRKGALPVTLTPLASRRHFWQRGARQAVRSTSVESRAKSRR